VTSYEVTLQLDTTDQRPIIRVIEYRDIKRTVFPQYQSDDIGKMIEDGGLEISYDKGRQRYRTNFSKGSFQTINPLVVHSANFADETRT
jgi:hypothetical protein